MFTTEHTLDHVHQKEVTLEREKFELNQKMEAHQKI
jgi:hypothetical protein